MICTVMRMMRKRTEGHTQTSQSVDTIDIHGTRPTDTLSTTPSESQSRIDLVLDADQSVQHHGSRLVEIEGVALHLGLGGGLIRVPAVDVESLDLCVGVRLGLVEGGCLGLGHDGARRRVDRRCKTAAGGIGEHGHTGSHTRRGHETGCGHSD